MQMRLEVMGSRDASFEVSFELDQMTGSCLSGTPRFGMSAEIRRTAGWDQEGGVYPIITVLHGVLNSNTAQDMLGTQLMPPEALPLALPARGNVGYANLVFMMSNQTVQFLEDERVSKQSGKDMQLSLRLWGSVALAAPQKLKQSATSNPLAHIAPATIVDVRPIRSGNSANAIRIPRSDWLDRFLPGLGYGRSVLVELPLMRTPLVPEEYKQAVAALDAARGAFEHEDYRAVLKYGRDVLEHIGKLASDNSITTFCKERLAPLVGETKASAIDGAMNVLRKGVLNAGSHANAFTADRAIAIYVIETLAIQLRYISSVAAS